jgi:hypothetical protein
MNWINQFKRWFRTQYTHQRFTSVRVEDLPDSLQAGVIYLVGDSPEPWSASLICPCGCGATISLSLVPDDEPSWQVKSSGAAITLHPSIWRTKGCRSHFIVRGGRVYWARGQRE